MSLRLETDRLVMRQFEQSDAKMVHGLAGSEEVARTTLSIHANGERNRGFWGNAWKYQIQI